MNAPYAGVDAARTALQQALQTVAGLRVYVDPGAVLDPPGAVLGAPTLVWDAYSEEPTQMTVPLSLVAAADERALSTLLGLLPAVHAAVVDVADAAVGLAAPGIFNASGTDLPAYLIDVEVAL